MAGISSRQGTHQLAQKCSITTLPDASPEPKVWPFIKWTSYPGAGAPSSMPHAVETGPPISIRVRNKAQAPFRSFIPGPLKAVSQPGADNLVGHELYAVDIP